MKVSEKTEVSMPIKNMVGIVVAMAKDAGANILVSGSTIFKENKGDLKKNIEILRNN